MNWQFGPRIQLLHFTFTRTGVMNWKSGSKSDRNTLHYQGPDGRIGAGLWARLKANPAGLPSGPRANINRP